MQDCPEQRHLPHQQPEHDRRRPSWRRSRRASGRRRRARVKLIDAKISRELMQLAEGGRFGVAFGGGNALGEGRATRPVPVHRHRRRSSASAIRRSTRAARVFAIYGELTAPVYQVARARAARCATTTTRTSVLRRRRRSASRSSRSSSSRCAARTRKRSARRVRRKPAARASASRASASCRMGSPNIQPETAKSYTLGLIFEPMPGMQRARSTSGRSSARTRSSRPTRRRSFRAGTPLHRRLPIRRSRGRMPNTFIYYDSNGELATVSGFYDERQPDDDRAASTSSCGAG